MSSPKYVLVLNPEKVPDPAPEQLGDDKRKVNDIRVIVVDNGQSQLDGTGKANDEIKNDSNDVDEFGIIERRTEEHPL